MNLALHILTGKKKGEELLLPEDQDILISLKGENEVVLDDDSPAARKHAMISTGFQRLMIRDLNSEKGTLVNGKPVKEAELKEGDRLRLGPVMCMVVALNRFSPGYEASKARTEMLYNANSRSKPALDSLSAIAGTLKEMSPIDIIQFLSNSKKSGVLTLVSSQNTGKIYLRDGQVVYAEIEKNPAVHPERILIRMLAWNDGTFSFGPPEDRVFPTEIKSGAENLLMEGARVIDELARLQAELPDRNARLDVLEPPEGSYLHDLSPQELEVLELVIKHVSLQAVVDHHPIDDVEASAAVAELLRRKFIGVQIEKA